LFESHFSFLRRIGEAGCPAAADFIEGCAEGTALDEAVQEGRADISYTL